MTTLRRNLKNTVNNYSDVQCKVREATCNEPWGPATTLMTEISDATYAVVEFAEIMSVLWKRLNDHGKNWRHVYKALLVMDFIIKRGSERVAQQCKEQIYFLLTLQDFRFIDKDGKDVGGSVREKARQLVALLKDEERLKMERKSALQAKERFAQNSVGIGSAGSKPPKSSTLARFTSGRASSSTQQQQQHLQTSPSSSSQQPGPSEPRLSDAMEKARPSDRDEEALQIELALAISKEEADKEKQQDDADIRATLERSRTETQIEQPTLLSLSRQAPPPPPPPTYKDALDPWGMPVSDEPTAATNDPWGGASSSTWQQPEPVYTQPGAYTQPTHYTQPSLLDTSLDNVPAGVESTGGATLDLLSDPWMNGNSGNVNSGGLLQPSNSNTVGGGQMNLLGNSMDCFDPFTPQGGSEVPLHLTGGGGPSPGKPLTLPYKMNTILDTRAKQLVNIDNLISNPSPAGTGNTNPFGLPASSTAPRPAPAAGSVFSGTSTNPFLNTNTAAPTPSLNQLRESGTGGGSNSSSPIPTNPFC